MSTAAYGAGKAGATFDPMTFVKKPQVVLKLMCFVSYDDNFKVVKVRNQSRLYSTIFTFAMGKVTQAQNLHGFMSV